ncbi:Ty3/gypsy retrotransposon protein [Quillaja saponaria]|uniref:Ty3/gypsy retrotransposon protein n=1 Tax=Quillaja saponaria TaxID=32244 RepID=A0AAD7LK10_QUISA|nr:Ty3/gypsy retrotransposon protein [Quillaja saponaria]
MVNKKGGDDGGHGGLEARVSGLEARLDGIETTLDRNQELVEESEPRTTSHLRKLDERLSVAMNKSEELSRRTEDSLNTVFQELKTMIINDERGTEGLTWEEYLQEMTIRFQRGVLAKPIIALKNLKQVSTVEEYNDEFEFLKNQCVIPKELLLDHYLGGGRVERGDPECWETDEVLRELVPKLQAGSIKDSKFTWQEGLLKKKGKLVVGKNPELRKDLLDLFHASSVGGHSGVQATLKRLQNVFYWKGMQRAVRNLVRECDICQKYKTETNAYPGLLTPLPIPKRLWSSISMDFIEGLPESDKKNVVLVVVDRLSKFSHFVGLRHPYTALTVAQAFTDQVYKFQGLPENIVSDRDPVFMSKFWTELFKIQGVQLNHSSAYHPQSDGQTEVVNRTVEAYLRCFARDCPKHWSKWLSLAQYWYNTNYRTTIQMSPYHAVFGQEPPSHIPYTKSDSENDAVDRSLSAKEGVIQLLKENIKKAQNRMKMQADRHRTERAYEVGNWVYLKLQSYKQHSINSSKFHKLAAKYYGPFLILKKIGLVAYALQLPPSAKIHNVFHVSLLKTHHGRHEVQAQLPQFSEDGLVSPEPVKVLDKRMVKKNNKAVVQLLVEWSHTAPEDATWMDYQKLKKQFPQFHPWGQGSFEGERTDMNIR